MKIPNKREFQEITINHSSDIDFNDTTLESDSPLHVTCNLVEKNVKGDEKLQWLGKYEYRTGKEISSQNKY